VEVHIEDDDGRMQGGKRTAACASEFQKVNNFRVRFKFGHVTLCRTQSPPDKKYCLF
jgi:hypothetical protein